MSAAGFDTTEQREQGLSRGLSSAQLTMIAIGGLKVVAIVVFILLGGWFVFGTVSATTPRRADSSRKAFGDVGSGDRSSFRTHRSR
jgi:L-asparagine transporter-like permease